MADRVALDVGNLGNSGNLAAMRMRQTDIRSELSKKSLPALIKSPPEFPRFPA